MFVPLTVTSPAGASAVVPPGSTEIHRAKSGCASKEVTVVTTEAEVAYPVFKAVKERAAGLVHFCLRK